MNGGAPHLSDVCSRRATDGHEPIAVGKAYGWGYNIRYADVAQPEEQRFRKPQVKGSSPFIGSTIVLAVVALLAGLSIKGIWTDPVPIYWTKSSVRDSTERNSAPASKNRARKQKPRHGALGRRFGPGR